MTTCYRCATNHVPPGTATCEPCQREIYQSNPNGTAWRPPSSEDALTPARTETMLREALNEALEMVLEATQSGNFDKRRFDALNRLCAEPALSEHQSLPLRGEP